VVDLVGAGVQTDRVGLAARVLEIVLVIVGSAATPTAVHKFLVVHDTHAVRDDAPVGMPWVAFCTLAVIAVGAAVVVSMAAIQVYDRLSWRDCRFLHIILL
jgi:hypothetical protein